MAATVFDQSAGREFTTSNHLARNKVEEGFNVWEIIRSNRDRFDDAWLSTHGQTFGIIPTETIVADRVRAYLEQDDFKSQTTFPLPYQLCHETIPPNPAVDEPWYFNKCLGAIEWFGELMPQSGQIIQDATITPSGGTIRALNQASYSTQTITQESDGRVHAKFSTQKSRVKLAHATAGFMATAKFVYTSSDLIPPWSTLGLNIPMPTSISNVHLLEERTYPRGEWVPIPFPTDFNTENINFLILLESPAQWTARTGYPIT